MKGFTIIETLIAFTILSIVLGYIANTTSIGVQLSYAQNEQDQYINFLQNFNNKFLDDHSNGVIWGAGVIDINSLSLIAPSKITSLSLVQWNTYNSFSWAEFSILYNNVSYQWNIFTP